MIDSYLQLSYAIASRTNALKSSVTLDLNAWYFVMITLTGVNATLSVDGQDASILIANSPFTVLDVRSNLFVGGYSSHVQISSLTGTSEGFYGSVSHFEINGRMLDLIIDADFGFGVTESNVSTCAGNPCSNGGECVPFGPSFVCNCPVGFTGLLCGSMSDPCETGTTLCADGSTCQSSNDGLSFACICPLGRGGNLCDQGELHYS